MKPKPSRFALACLAAGTATLLGACVYDAPYGQQPVYAQPAYGGYAPPPNAAGYAYAPGSDDAYLPYTSDADVVLIGGDTYIWLIGSNGQRYRRFYEHGDHRADVYQRRAQLRGMTANRGPGGPGNYPGGARAYGGGPRTSSSAYPGGSRAYGNAPHPSAGAAAAPAGGFTRPAPASPPPAAAPARQPIASPLPGNAQQRQTQQNFARPGGNPGNGARGNYPSARPSQDRRQEQQP